MNQFYSHHDNWEDFKNGMYCGTISNDTGLSDKAKSLLCNPDLFYSTIKKMIVDWPIATKVNLTNKGINRRSWLGHAACSFLYNVPEIITRIAWKEMNEVQQFEANTVAEKCIIEFEQTYA